MLGVFGPPGATIPGTGLLLKVAAIRGVESHGMMCSVRELELGDEHDGIIELPAETHPFFVASQYHPEFKSLPLRPQPLFRDFVGAARDRALERAPEVERGVHAQVQASD